LAAVFEVPLSEFFAFNNADEVINLPLLQKIKMIDTLALDEQTALLKMIDLALANKKLKDNLSQLLQPA